MLQKRVLGRSGLEVSPLALGGNVFGWTIDEAASFAILDGFAAAGGNFIDTADMYSRWVPGHAGGESENIIGRWMKSRGNRDRMVIATKVGMEMGPDAKGLAPDYIARSVEGSLKRLQTDYIDLYQSHMDDASIPLEETLGAYARLVEQGKVRAIGASNHAADRLESAIAASAGRGFPAYTVLQPLYNLMERQGYEGALADVCSRHGVGVIPYFSLASGFLTGKYRSQADLGKSPRGAWIAKYLDERGMRVLAALDQVAEARNTEPGAVALAWLLTRPNISAPIASATSAKQLQSLLDGVSLTLTAEEAERLTRASAL